MTAIGLKIIEPVHDSAYLGVPTVTFRGATIGQPNELKNVILYYRWYSSLKRDVHKDHYSLNETAWIDPGVPFSKELGVGSHAITFAVSDHPGQAATDMEAIKHGGVTGGSQGSDKCLVHVFKANLIEPRENTPLQKKSGTLVAEAPLNWCQAIKDTNPIQFEVNNEYDKINRLQYRWEFVPIGVPDTRQTVNFIPNPSQYIFKPEEVPKLITLQYTGPLPADLNGNYRLILHVEDRYGILGGHQDSVAQCSVS